MKNKSEIVSKLVNEGKTMFQRPKKQIVSFIRNSKYLQRKEADKLLNNFDKYPHAFVIGCIADKQVDADIAWLTPYNIYSQVESFEISALAKIELSQFRDIMENAKPKHRFHKMLSEEIYYGIKHIVKDYGGNASKIWANKPSCALVAKRFSEFKGIGPKISSMATNILARDFKIQFSDYSCIDISADVHVQRVFTRLGLCNEGSSIEEIIKAARTLHPEFPGLMDLPTWEIGRDFCHPTTPQCNECYMRSLCTYSK